MYNMSSVASDCFTYSLPVCMPFIYLLVFLDCFFAARTSNTMLNKSDDSGYACLVPDLRVSALTFSPLRMVSCVFLIYGLYYVEVSSLYTHFLESFYHKYVLDFVKRFSSSIKIIIWLLFLSLCDVSY